MALGSVPHGGNSTSAELAALASVAKLGTANDNGNAASDAIKWRRSMAKPLHYFKKREVLAVQGCYAG